MSNPYEPNLNKPGDQPQQPQQPAWGQPGQGQQGQYGPSYPAYGGQQWGSQSPYGAQQPTTTDGLSITAFVLSLTCCLSFIGLILGFVGLGRTKNNQRKGRWAAVSAIVIGGLGTLALIGVVAVAVFVGTSAIDPRDAEVGECGNILSEDRDTITMTSKDCDSKHDLEIVYVGTYDEIEDSQFLPSDPDDLTDAGISAGVCIDLMPSEDVATLDEADDELRYGIVTEDTSPNGDDAFFCYVERPGDAKLEGSLLG
ncbi:DUF4190 domain-containing protein [Nocardioides zeae]|uniref:DUF4190 domain-containing protein n=1 Tax=Nocardioides zeae TaxID=1457234 RepID=A0A6P0HF07_9ACTN|nr:DUF4190 domain-containing protein [Nocardioides zeae]NEN77309.1 DUF4190 domain-containing protein [Nocardioides zeae]